jgi:hypothetical protein
MGKFIIRIGDNEIELEGKTRDEALKKVGLNPQHWQANKGENMESKQAANLNKKQSPEVNIAKKRPAHSLKTESKSKSNPTNYRHKSNITTEDIGRWYTDGKDVWKLESFIPEPQVSMSKVAKADEMKNGYLSDFKDFRRLIPEPEPRKRIKK